MTNSRSPFFFIVVSLAILCPSLDAQKASMPASVNSALLSLDRMNNGQHVAATAGQAIEITLATIGAKQYGAPKISSSAIRFESVALKMPANPGGPTQIYRFDAVHEGEAWVQFLQTNPDNVFVVTIRVRPASDKSGDAAISMMPDQGNTGVWKNAWTNLLNDARQSFTPSLPTLASVEVGLVVGNSGPSRNDD